MTLNTLHVSYSSASKDGGIAVSLSQLLSAQHKAGYFSRWLTSDQFSPWRRDLQLKQISKSLNPTVLHFHGLWRSHTRMLANNNHSNLPVILSPHGMLDPWAMSYSPWKKFLAWHLWEHKAFSKSFCIHALCAAEAQSIRKYAPTTPIALIPNGVEIPTAPLSTLPPPIWHNIIPSSAKVLLFLGRFHHKKGIDPLITAWQSVLSDAINSNWWLVFVGFGDDGKLQSQLSNFPIRNCLAFDAVYGLDKASAFHHSSAFVLPSFSEGLPMAALEAMSYKTPCLLSSACNLPDAIAASAALLAEPNVQSLRNTLSLLFALHSSDLSKMGQRGFDLVIQDYDWKVVAKKFFHLYNWSSSLEPRPDFVI